MFGLVETILNFGLMDWAYYLGLIPLLMLLGVIMCDELNDRFKRIPFGPIRVPLLGNCFQLIYYDRNYLHKSLTKMALSHSTTMKCWFGTVGSVVITGMERINDILRNDDWVGENDEVWILDRTRKSKDQRATVRENADSIRVWASVRMYANQILKDYGFGKNEDVDKLMKNKTDDLRGLIQYWKDNNRGKDIEMTKTFFLPFALGINWAYITGESTSIEDNAILQQILKLIKQWEEITINTSRYLNYWPSLRKWKPIKARYEKLADINFQIRTLLQNLINEYRAKGSYKQFPKNLIEKFLEKIDEKEATPDKNGSGTEEILYSDNTLISVLFNLLCPSVLVLQSTLNHACLALSKYPEIQQKLKNEVMERWRSPNGIAFGDLSNSSNMPYLTAFILEMYRVGNVIPLEKRKMLKTVREKDTRVTHGMTLVINYDSANFDPNTWNEPLTFNPERFLDKTGKNVMNEDKLLALVAAKRLCIGEQVAKPVIMYFISSLVRNFVFSSSDSSATLFQPESGIINNPPPYLLKIN